MEDNYPIIEYKNYIIESDLLILPEDLRDKIFNMLPVSIKFALITNDEVISHIMMPFHRLEDPPKIYIRNDFISCYPVLDQYFINIIYGKYKPHLAIAAEINQLSPTPISRNKLLQPFNIYNELLRCFICKECRIINIQSILHLRIALILDIYVLILHQIKFYKISILDIYSNQTPACNSNKYYAPIITFRGRYESELVILHEALKLLIDNCQNVNSNIIRFDPDTRDVYLILTKMLHDLIRSSDIYPILTKLSIYIAKRLKYPLYWLYSISNFSYDYCNCFICSEFNSIDITITTKYILYHLKRLCDETLPTVSSIVDHMLIYHTSVILTNSVVKYAIANRGFNYKYDIIYDKLIDKYQEIYNTFITPGN